MDRRTDTHAHAHTHVHTSLIFQDIRDDSRFDRNGNAARSEERIENSIGELSQFPLQKKKNIIELISFVRS